MRRVLSELLRKRAVGPHFAATDALVNAAARTTGLSKQGSMDAMDSALQVRHCCRLCMDCSQAFFLSFGRHAMLTDDASAAGSILACCDVGLDSGWRSIPSHSKHGIMCTQ